MRRGFFALAVLQALLVGLYVAVERSRAPQPPFRAERLDEPAPALRWERPGQQGALPDGLVVVHFWATWCAPCQKELPALLAAAEREGVPLLAVSEEPWAALAPFFDGRVPEAVVRDPSGRADDAWQVSALPDTFVVRDGRVRGRAGGARSWESPASRTFLRGESP